MSREKRNVTVCDICGEAEITSEPRATDISMDVLGLTMLGGFYAGPGGGGGIGKNVFVCEGCIDGTSDGGPGVPLTVRDLISVLVFDHEVDRR